MSEHKEQTYLKGAAILIAANLLVKIIGAVFKIPLATILQEEGIALFNTAYNIYATLFVIATAGLPVAVSKMVSESLAKNNRAEVRRIFKIAVTLLSAVGLFGMLVLLFGAHRLAALVGSPDSAPAIIAVAPAIFFVAVLSAFRGYFQGHSDMIPTAISEVAEALGKLVIGLALSYVLMPSGYARAAAGAVLGVTGGTLAACLIMALTYVFSKRRTGAVLPPAAGAVRSSKSIFKTLLLLAVPITIGAAVTSLTNVIDMAMIRQRLQTIEVDSSIFKLLTEYYGVSADYVTPGAMLAHKPSDVLYGAYTGFAIPLFNLPPTIVMALSMSIVPAISGAFALKNYSKIRLLTESTIRITVMFSVPCAVGLSVLASPILTALFNNARSDSLLSVLSFAVISVCLVSVTTAMLQATGRVMLPVKNMLIGGAVKIVTNYIFIAIPSINIGGAPITTNLCYITIAVLNICDIIRILKPRLGFTEFVLKPVLSALAMGIGAYLIYNLLAPAMGIPHITAAISFLPQLPPVTPVAGAIRVKVIIALAVTIAAACIIYAAMLFLLKCVKRDDIIMLPKGEKIAEALDRLHLLS